VALKDKQQGGEAFYIFCDLSLLLKLTKGLSTGCLGFISCQKDSLFARIFAYNTPKKFGFNFFFFFFFRGQKLFETKVHSFGSLNGPGLEL
jgi:hypothetical protein